MKIKKGDLVKVISGGENKKGMTGRVLRVFPDTNRVMVEGVAKIKRHLKPQKQQKHPEGGIIEDVGTVHISNVMLMSEALGRPVRTGTKLSDDNKKLRVARGRDLKPEVL